MVIYSGINKNSDLWFPYCGYLYSERALRKSTKRHILHLDSQNENVSESACIKINNFVDVETIKCTPLMASQRLFHVENAGGE